MLSDLAKLSAERNGLIERVNALVAERDEARANAAVAALAIEAALDDADRAGGDAPHRGLGPVARVQQLARREREARQREQTLRQRIDDMRGAHEVDLSIAKAKLELQGSPDTAKLKDAIAKLKDAEMLRDRNYRQWIDADREMIARGRSLERANEAIKKMVDTLEAARVERDEARQERDDYKAGAAVEAKAADEARREVKIKERARVETEQALRDQETLTNNQRARTAELEKELANTRDVRSWSKPQAEGAAAYTVETAYIPKRWDLLGLEATIKGPGIVHLFTGSAARNAAGIADDLNIAYAWGRDAGQKSKQPEIDAKEEEIRGLVRQHMELEKEMLRNGEEVILRDACGLEMGMRIVYGMRRFRLPIKDREFKVGDSAVAVAPSFQVRDFDDCGRRDSQGRRILEEVVR